MFNKNFPYASRLEKLYHDYQAESKESSQRDILFMYIVEAIYELLTINYSDEVKENLIEAIILQIEKFIKTSDLSDIFDFNKPNNVKDRLEFSLRKITEAWSEGTKEHQELKTQTNEFLLLVKEKWGNAKEANS
jgi:hypothetical protein